MRPLKGVEGGRRQAGEQSSRARLGLRRGCDRGRGRGADLGNVKPVDPARHLEHPHRSELLRLDCVAPSRFELPPLHSRAVHLLHCNLRVGASDESHKALAVCPRALFGRAGPHDLDRSDVSKLGEAAEQVLFGTLCGEVANKDVGRGRLGTVVGGSAIAPVITVAAAPDLLGQLAHE